MVEHRGPAPANTVRSMWLGAMLLLLGVAMVSGRALADADCGESEPPKASSKGKCPAGFKYSAKTKGCVKVSCGGGRVWSGESQSCIDSHSAGLVDQDFYDEARACR